MYVCMSVCMYVCVCVCVCVRACVRACMYVCMYVPYLSVLKPGSYTRRGSNIRQVVQQNEGNKCLGPFKRRVSKLFNLINVKMVLYIKENKLIVNIPLDMCILLSDIATVDRRSIFAMFVVFSNLCISSVSGVHTLL